MLIKSKYYLKEREGETRIRRKFLWWPRFFDSSFIRWLEYADIIECIKKLDNGGSGEWGNYAWRWREVGFSYKEAK